MKAAYSEPGSGKVELREVEIPKVDEGELLVKMRAVGICGTDLEKVYGKPITPPMLGHEVVGDIVIPDYLVGQGGVLFNKRAHGLRQHLHHEAGQSGDVHLNLLYLLLEALTHSAHPAAHPRPMMFASSNL